MMKEKILKMDLSKMSPVEIVSFIREHNLNDEELTVLIQHLIRTISTISSLITSSTKK